MSIANSFSPVSPVASSPHDPALTLASNCIREYFGPSVQVVADCLQARGGASTLAQLVSAIQLKYRSKTPSEEREQISKDEGLQPSSVSGCDSSPASIRASLLVLLQHSLVTVVETQAGAQPGSTESASNALAKPKVSYKYTFHQERAIFLPRYPRFVEYTKKALDEIAAALVEELLFQGRIGTVDAVMATIAQLEKLENPPRPGSGRYTLRQSILESLRRLVGGGFIVRVNPVPRFDEAELEGEMEFDGGESLRPKKKARTEPPATDDPSVLALLQTGPYKTIAREAVWKVNVAMFHDSLRAVSLGWLVAERFGQRIQSSGSMVTAALKLAAHKEHAERDTNFESRSMFTATSITRYLPKAVLQNLEKKAGGVVMNLHESLLDLTKTRNPKVVEEVEAGDGQPENTKFQIATRKLVGYLHQRIAHQLVLDCHGDVAARICNILRRSGYLESDAISEYAMVPAKDTREILHRLYRAGFICLFNVGQGKQHNPGTMVYLWYVDKRRMTQKVTDMVCTCLGNLRLRRQHEIQVGRDWIERAKDAEATDENENEADKINYQRFCQGLERLDNAILQLDETLMVLTAY